MPELYNKIGVGLMAWAPLTMGLISSKIEDGAIPLVSRSILKNKYSSFSWAEDETTNKEVKKCTFYFYFHRLVELQKRVALIIYLLYF